MPAPKHNLSNDDARVRYYVALAREARAAYIASQFQRAFAWLRKVGQRVTDGADAHGARDRHAQA